MIIPASLSYSDASDFQIVEVVAILPSKLGAETSFDLLLLHTRLWARLQSCEERLLASSCLSVRPSVLPSECKQLGFRSTDFHEI